MVGNGTASSIAGAMSSTRGTTPPTFGLTTPETDAETLIISFPPPFLTPASSAPPFFTRSCTKPVSGATRARPSPSRVLGVSESDPIDTDDPSVLRAEILRLRDRAASIDARVEVLEALIATRDTQITEYDAEVNRLRDVVAQSAITRVRQAIDRRRS